MRSVIITSLASLLLLTACKKEEETVAVKSLDQQKLEYQAKQLEIERQKLAIEQEKIKFEKAKDSLEKVQQEAKQSFTAQKETGHVASKPQVVTKTKTVYVNNTASSKTGNRESTGNTTSGTEVSQQQDMSKAAKGTIIGTVGGATAGALLNKKNRGAGAVIGGIVGGATGYTIGRSKDKQDGRAPAN